MPVMPRPKGKATKIARQSLKDTGNPEDDKVEDNKVDWTRGITEDKKLKEDMRKQIKR